MTREKELEEIIRKVLSERTDITFVPDLATPIAEELCKYGYEKVGEYKRKIKK